MGYWVRFREDGTPIAASSSRMPDSEWVEESMDTLATCQRIDGVWMPREPEPEPELEPEPKGRLARLNDWLWGH
jgi:hypothetical protein